MSSSLVRPASSVPERPVQSGKPVDRRAVTDFRGDRVGFCGTAHRDRFARATQAFDRLISCQEDEIKKPAVVEKVILRC